MSEQQTYALREILRAYPNGGFAGICEDTGISETALRSFANGDHVRIPWSVIHPLERLSRRGWACAPKTLDDWVSCWERTRDDRCL